jgi:hypothetical protein
VTFDIEIPTLRCSVPTRRQGDLSADPDVLRTVNIHADHSLGVYATVARAGMLTEGDLLEFEPATAGRTPAALLRAGTVLKRGALRVADAVMPTGK